MWTGDYGGVLAGEADSAGADEAELAGLGDAGKAALLKERRARRDALARASSAEGRVAELVALQESAVSSVAVRDEQLRVLGEEREALAALNDSLVERLRPGVLAEWEAAPEKVTSLFRGDAGDVLAMRAFLDDHAELIVELSEKAVEARKRFRTPMAPVPNGLVAVKSKAAPTLVRARL